MDWEVHGFCKGTAFDGHFSDDCISELYNPVF